MCFVSVSGWKELSSYQLLERKKQEPLFTEVRCLDSRLALPHPHLFLIHTEIQASFTYVRLAFFSDSKIPQELESDLSNIGYYAYL